jgi:hypothetical protein
MEMYHHLYDQAIVNVSRNNERSLHRNPILRPQPRLIRTAISSIARAITAAGR